MLVCFLKSLFLRDCNTLLVKLNETSYRAAPLVGLPQLDSQKYWMFLQQFFLSAMLPNNRILNDLSKPVLKYHTVYDKGDSSAPPLK